MSMNDHQFDFSCDVLEQSHELPVLVDFWAQWCGPCRMLTPVLERIAEKFSGKVKLVKINTEEYPDIASRYNVSGIPNVKLFIDGSITDEFTGALPEAQIEQWLKRALPSRYSAEVKLAQDLVGEGKERQAAAILDEVLVNEADNIAALALMIRIRLFGHPDDALKLNERLEGEPGYGEFCDAVRTLGGLLQKDEDALPDDPVRERYRAALACLRSGAFSDAIEAFIGVIRENRYYDDDGSRKACIAIFKYLGEDHPVTLKHRRVFDRALY